MKLNKRIKVLVISVVVIILGSAISLAYFTARNVKTNNLRLGFNKIEILEEYNPPVKMTPGISFTKKPYVVNSGDVPCYVRVKVAISDSRVEKDIDITNNNADYKENSNYTYNEDDGYFYYKKVLNPGEKTEALFDTVNIHKDAGDLVLEGFDIYVYGESVQTIDDIESNSSMSDDEKMSATWENYGV